MQPRCLSLVRGWAIPEWDHGRQLKSRMILALAVPLARCKQLLKSEPEVCCSLTFTTTSACPTQMPTAGTLPRRAPHSGAARSGPTLADYALGVPRGSTQVGTLLCAQRLGLGFAVQALCAVWWCQRSARVSTDLLCHRHVSILERYQSCTKADNVTARC